MAAQGKIRVAVIGVGVFGRHHARLYRELTKEGEAEFVGLVDTDPARAAAIASEFGVPAFSSMEELVEKGKPQAASVAVPTVSHLAVARTLLQAGVDVMVEKPVAPTLADADEMVRIARSSRRVAQVGQLERFNPAVRATLPLLTKPLFFEVHRLSVFTPRSLDVDVVLDLMIHDLDIILNLMRSPVTKVSAIGAAIQGEDEDLAVAHLTLQNGCLASFVASRVSPVKAAELEITLPDGMIHLNYLRQLITVGRRGSQQRTVVKGEEPLRAELTHFVECVRGNARPLVPGEHGLRALEAAHTILGKMTVITSRVPV